MDISPTLTVVPAELARGGWYRTVAALGIATSHELWVSEEGDRAVYIAAPESGPSAVLVRWARTAHEFPAWNFSTHDNEERLNQQFAAEDTVILEARAEVRAELS